MIETTLEKAQAKVKEIQIQLSEAKETERIIQKEYSTRTKEQKLAIIIHEVSCRWNHTDGCSWFYEKNDGVRNWNGFAHAKYLAKAIKITTNFPEITVDDLIQILKIAK